MVGPLLLRVTRTGPVSLLSAHRLRAIGRQTLTVPLFNIHPMAEASRQL